MSDFIQTANELSDLCYRMCTDEFGISKYRKDDTDTNYGWEYNVGKWENNSWHSDCLGFVHIAVNGFKGDKTKLGGGAIMNDFVYNTTEYDTLHKYCTDIGDFPKTDLQKGTLLQSSGHVGIYIGDCAYGGEIYNTAECTLAGVKGWILTWTDLSDGSRHLKKGGIRLATSWEHWGYFKQIDYSNSVSQKFTDVPPSDSGYEAIEWLSNTGAIVGYKDGTYRPDNSVTRRQIAVILFRYTKWLLKYLGK